MLIPPYNMNFELVLGVVCIIINCALFVYNQFYFKEIKKADEQIGIAFHPFLIKCVKLNMIFIGFVAFVTLLCLLFISIH